MKSKVETMLKKIYKKLRGSVTSFIKRNEKDAFSRLDALVTEKAMEEGIELNLAPKRNSWIKYFFIGSMSTSLLAVVAFIVLFAPGPWTRFIAAPIVSTFDLEGVEYTEHGVIASNQQITLVAPKPIKGVQYVENKVTIVPEVQHEISLSEDNTEIIISPLEELSPDTVYTISLEPGVLFEDSTYLSNDQSWIIPTKATFDIVSISPSDNDIVSKDATIQITFTTDEFELDEVSEYISIQPKIDGDFQKISSRVIFAPKKNLVVGGEYTVVVHKGLSGVSGETLDKDYYSTFSITDSSTENYNVPYIGTYQPFFNHTDGYRSIPFYASNIPAPKAVVYSVTWDEIKENINKYLYASGSLNFDLLLADRKVKRIIPIKTEYKSKDYGNYSILLNKETKGIYVIKIFDANHPAIKRYLVSFVSDYGSYVVPKNNGESVDLWGFKYKTRELGEAVSFTGYSCTDETSCQTKTVKTNKEGYADINMENEIAYILLNKDKSYALLAPGSSAYQYINFNFKNNTIVSEVITNKPSYYPNDSLKASILLREKNSQGEFSYVKDIDNYSAVLCNRYGIEQSLGLLNLDSCISEKDLVQNSSEVEVSFNLWDKKEDLVLYVIHSANGRQEIITSKHIYIYEIDKPQVQMSLDTDKSRYINNERIVISGQVSNYVNVGIPNKKVAINIYVSGQNSSFSNGTMNVVSDSQGNFTYEYELPYDRAINYEYDISISATLIDGDNTIYKYTSAVWDSDERIVTKVYVDGYETEFVGENEEATVQLSAENISTGNSIDKQVNVRIRRDYSVEVLGNPYYDDELQKMVTPRSYIAQHEYVLEQDYSISKSKPVVVPINDLKSGTYVIELTEFRESLWNIDLEENLFYVSSLDGDSLNTINEWVYNVVFDKTSYDIGDKAKLEIGSTFDERKSDLIFIQNGGENIEWRKIDYKTKEIEIPITKSMQGGLTVCIVHPLQTYAFKNDSRESQFVGHSIRNRCTSVIVEDSSKELQVSLNPEKKVVEPGEKSNLNIKLTDSQGKPIEGDVGITIVDKSIYDEFYQGESYKKQILDLYKDMYQTYRYVPYAGFASTFTDEVIYGAPGGMGAGGQSAAQSIRRDFNVNPLWVANTRTNDSGEVTVMVPYSESITTWVILAWATTEDLHAGSTYTEVQTTKDAYVEVDVPKVVREGDIWVPYVRVVNTDKNALNGNLEISCNGCLEDPVSKSITLKPFSVKDFNIKSTVTKIGSLPFTAILKKDNKIVDGMEVQINSRSIGYQIPFKNTYFISDSDDSKQFEISDNVDVQRSNFSLYVSKYPVGFKSGVAVNSQVSTTSDIAKSILSLSIMKEESLYAGSIVDENTVESYLRIYLNAIFSRYEENGGYSYNSYGGLSFPATFDVGFILSYLKEIDYSDPRTQTEMSKLGSFFKSQILGNSLEVENKAKSLYLLSKLDPSVAVRLVTTFNQDLKNENVQVSEVSKVYLALALAEVGANSDASALTIDLLENSTTSVGDNGLYLSGNNSYFKTAALAFLVKDLALDTEYSEELKGLQTWFVEGISSQLDSIEKTISFSLYYKSLLEANKTSAKAESVVVSINNNKLPEINYDGNSSFLNIPYDIIEVGSNTLDVSTESSKPLFVTIVGTLYSDLQESSINNDMLDFKVDVKGLSSDRSILAGKYGHYFITISALEDVPKGNFQLSLPTGLVYSPHWYSEYKKYSKSISYAYGDPKHSDVLSADIPALKEGESYYVVVTFRAIREGDFNGASLVYSNSLLKMPYVKIDKRVKVK